MIPHSLFLRKIIEKKFAFNRLIPYIVSMDKDNNTFKKGDVVVTRCGKIYQLADNPIQHPTWGACANVRKYRTNIVHGIRLRDVRPHPFFK